MMSIIVVAIIVIIAFFLGRKFASKPIEDRNEEIQKRCEELHSEEVTLELKIKDLLDDITRKEEQICAAERRQLELQQQYEEKLKIIENTKQLADEELQQRRKILNQEFENEKQEIQNQKNELLTKVEEVQLQLQSLENTKAAALEALRKEEEIKANKEYYSLVVPKVEQRDIEILEETKMRISKPRAISMVIWTAYYQQIAKKQFPKILGKQNVCGIYKITNIITDECYVGQSKDVRLRWYDHTKAAIGIDTPTGNKLYAAMQKYGIENFTFELLEECPPQDLDKKEKYYISLYNSNSLGYNGNKGVN